MDKKYKVLSINASNFGSTGSIMMGISELAEKNNYEAYMSYPSSMSNNQKSLDNSIIISNRIERNIHLKLAYHTGMNGCYSKLGTKIFLNKISKVKPDIIHLHNLHNCYINLELLFNYIKTNNIPIVWTLHDCWAFTGQCPHYTIAECYKWKRGCYDCPQYTQYPASREDRTQEMYTLKKSWFTGVEKLTIVTPSEWLKKQVKESFLSEYPVKVINNGINLEIFKPTDSNFKEIHNIKDKIMLLGVANPWSKRKGLDVLIELSIMLDDSFKIVLVGLTDEQRVKLPKNIIGVPKTNSQMELAEIYSAADVFLNPTYEDTFPTTNLEAMACGTPIITFNTGGSVEVINKYTGRIVENNNLSETINAINDLIFEGREKYIYERIQEAKKYNRNNKFDEYIDLYNSI